MRFRGGLKADDWEHWGQFTTFKTNAAELLNRTVQPSQVIYCSPLVDPYQPVENQQRLMPDLLQAALRHPPRAFVLQTRGPLVLRDLALWRDLAAVTTVRISFSVTTDRDDVRRRYEPHCESNDSRLETIEKLRCAGLEVYATLAPILPCDPTRLVTSAIQASGRDLIGDPPHLRSTKTSGATTRQVAFQIARAFGESQWFNADFQEAVVREMITCASQLGYGFRTGTEGFSLLSRTQS